MATITVLMPCRNAERYIRETIDSVLVQTFRDFKFLIIDDGSDDQTSSIVDAYASRDARIKVVHRSPSAGVAASLNLGLSIAETKLVAQIHADDRMKPHRLERQIAFMQEHPEIAVASSFVHLINQEGRRVGVFRSEFITHDSIDRCLRENHLIGFHHPAVIMRRDEIIEVGGYRNISCCEDLDLWNRLVESGHRILVQPEFLIDYRIHDTAISTKQSWTQMLQSRWIYDSMIRRRRGEPELSWDAFLQKENDAPVLSRLNRIRKSYAEVLYKLAATDFACRRYIATFTVLSAAAILAPYITIRKAFGKSLFAEKLRTILLALRSSNQNLN